MNFIQLEFELPDDLHEQFIAELMDHDFHGFEQLDNKLIAFIEAPRYNDTIREFIEQMVSVIPDVSFKEIASIEERNWNEVWEQTIQPQRIGPFFVKPTWSIEKAMTSDILLEIDPKMAFGTGYHETTRLMLRQIPLIDFVDKKVLDAGTGTGILAIAAIKSGASKAVGFDVDPWSDVNARENSIINQVDDELDIRLGGAEVIKDSEYFDITLANINRNVILDLIPFFVNRTLSGGTILLTGLLDRDELMIREKLTDEPVDILDLRQEGEWILFQLRKHQV
jgi:ribosomal protein L11 methyltransferase